MIRHFAITLPQKMRLPKKAAVEQIIEKFKEWQTAQNETLRRKVVYSRELFIGTREKLRTFWIRIHLITAI